MRGDVSAAALWRGAALALAATVVLSYLAAGPVGGTAHVVAVLSAWTYNLRPEDHRPLAPPYAVSFGLVPAFVTYGLTPPSPPAAWLVATCALLGVGAHLANAIPDVDTDEQVGAGGFVAAVGVRAASIAALVCLVAAVALLAAHLDVAAWSASPSSCGPPRARSRSRCATRTAPHAVPLRARPRRGRGAAAARVGAERHGVGEGRRPGRGRRCISDR